MVPRIESLIRNEHVRVIVVTGILLAVLVVATDATMAVLAPLVVIFAALTVHNAADDVYDLPNGSNWLSYGVSLVLAGAVLALLADPAWFGLVIAVPGLWFVLDGATTMVYEPGRSKHEFLADVEEDDSSEVMFRMQSLNRLYRGLRDAEEPLTVAELADEVEMLESRVESALEYLESKGQVERSGDRYEAVPPRWGKATPVVSFLVWVPRRLVKPFRRFVDG